MSVPKPWKGSLVDVCIEKSALELAGLEVSAILPNPGKSDCNASFSTAANISAGGAGKLVPGAEVSLDPPSSAKAEYGSGLLSFSCTCVFKVFPNILPDGVTALSPEVPSLPRASEPAKGSEGNGLSSERPLKAA